MGCCLSGDANDRAIERQVRAQKSRDAQIKKLLLLGAGGSGKSTIFNQLTLLHGGGLPEVIRKSYKRLVHGNIVDAMQLLIQKSREVFEDDPKAGTKIRSKNQELADEIIDLPTSQVTERVGRIVQTLWKDPGIRRTFQMRSKFHGPPIEDQCQYYFEQLDRIASPDYLPTVEDVLRVRQMTTGIKEQKFVMNKRQFRVLDVGGQRNERAKWIHCFESVTGVIFVCALSAYDQIDEDDRFNCMHLSLKLFKDTVNSHWFADSAIILFLNKKDLFKEKIGKDYKKPTSTEPMKVPLSECFRHCPRHDQDPYRQGIDFIRSEFQKRTKRHKIHIHETCATDTNQVEKVFQDVQHQVIKLALQKAALLGPD